MMNICRGSNESSSLVAIQEISLKCVPGKGVVNMALTEPFLVLHGFSPLALTLSLPSNRLEFG